MMSDRKKIEILKDAIEQRKSISFEYEKQGEPVGVRIGKPHALYRFISKLSEESIKLDLFQTGGVTRTELNEWKQLNICYLSDIKIINSSGSFQIASGYDPSSSRYLDYIAKIQ